MSLEPGACLSLWPTETCEWSTWDIWRSSDVVVHAIYVGFALMLGYTLFVLTRFLLRYQQHRHELRNYRAGFGTDDLGNRKRPIPDLSQGLGALKGISKAAPFLGLAGTSYGILTALWFPYSGSPERYFHLLFTRFAFSLTATLAGIMVAVPATVCYCLFCARVELFSRASDWSHDPDSEKVHSFEFAQELALKKRVSGLPPFALLAAPILACVTALFTPFHPDRIPLGLSVLLPSFSCRSEVTSRLIVLRVNEKGELFINTELVAMTDLPDRLSGVYSARASRDLYLTADDEAPFQVVANAVDAIRSPDLNQLGINIILLTPSTARGCVPIPNRIISKKHAFR